MCAATSQLKHYPRFNIFCFAHQCFERIILQEGTNLKRTNPKRLFQKNEKLKMKITTWKLVSCYDLFKVDVLKVDICGCVIIIVSPLLQRPCFHGLLHNSVHFPHSCFPLLHLQLYLGAAFLLSLEEPMQQVTQLVPDFQWKQKAVLWLCISPIVKYVTMSR